MKKLILIIAFLSCLTGCVADGIQVGIGIITGIDLIESNLPHDSDKDKNEPPKVEQ